MLSLKKTTTFAHLFGTLHVQTESLAFLILHPDIIFHISQYERRQ